MKMRALISVLQSIIYELALETINELKTAGYPTVTFSKDNHDGVLKAPFWYYDKDGKILVTEKVYTTE